MVIGSQSSPTCISSPAIYTVNTAFAPFTSNSSSSSPPPPPLFRLKCFISHLADPSNREPILLAMYVGKAHRASTGYEHRAYNIRFWAERQTSCIEGKSHSPYSNRRKAQIHWGIGQEEKKRKKRLFLSKNLGD